MFQFTVFLTDNKQICMQLMYAYIFREMLIFFAYDIENAINLLIN